MAGLSAELNLGLKLVFLGECLILLSNGRGGGFEKVKRGMKK